MAGFAKITTLFVLALAGAPKASITATLTYCPLVRYCRSNLLRPRYT